MLDNLALIDHIFKLTKIKPLERLALLYLVNRRHPERYWCRATQKQIGEQVGMSRYWVYEFVTRMRKREILVDIPMRKLGGKFINYEYWFLFDLEKLKEELFKTPDSINNRAVAKSLTCISFRLQHLKKSELHARCKPLPAAASRTTFD